LTLSRAAQRHEQSLPARQQIPFQIRRVRIVLEVGEIVVLVDCDPIVANRDRGEPVECVDDQALPRIGLREELYLV